MADAQPPLILAERVGDVLWLTLNRPAQLNAVSMAMFKALPYDTLKDYAMVTTIASFSAGVLVAPESPVKTTKELIALARSSGKFNSATIALGTAQHLAAELFKSMAGLNHTHVPFNNTGALIAALRGGDVQVAFEFLPPVLGQIRAGALRVVAVTSKTRFAPLPGVPTLDESGLPGYATDSWFGLVATAGTPADVLSKLNADTLRSMNQADVRERLAAQGLFVKTSTPAELSALMQSELVRWAKVIKSAGIKIE